MNFTLSFNNIDQSHTSEVGGKNASLGEMIQQLTSKGIMIPGGFATTSKAYRYFLEKNDLTEPLGSLMEKLDAKDFSNLRDIGQQARKMIMEAKMPSDLLQDIEKAYRNLQKREKNMKGVAVRSSATAEDLPSASFAGQHETFLNVKGKNNVIDAVQQCYASLFTDRAIKYRTDNDFDHMKVALSAGVQRMVRSDKASAGVIFTIAPDSGFEKVVYITGNWGLGENVVQGNINADEFFVFKPALKKNLRSIISKGMGSKKKTMVYDRKSESLTKNVKTPKTKRQQYVLKDEEVETLARWALFIEEHYDNAMDIEWAKDGYSGELFIVQARPETVHSGKEDEGMLKSYSLQEKSNEILRGNGIGDKIAAGKVRLLDSPAESDKLEKGDILVTEITNPDWDPVMEKASAIITNSGGRTSHAAIVAREIGAVAIVGSDNATKKLKDGQEVTVSCAEGTDGIVYEGILEWEEDEIDFSTLKKPKTEVMLILGDPGQAFKYSNFPVQGVGLLRLEFIINNTVKAHPMALLNYEKLKDNKAKRQIKRLTSHFDKKEDYFTEKLSQAVARIAAAFYPDDVIVRMSDFKSNEYANLIGGRQFEPDEENPMLGFRGASRYYHEKYIEGFRLECEAMRIVRDEMGLTNVKLMIPFCRTQGEGKKVLETMEKFGLKQGWNGLEIYMMVEIPSNVLLAEEFATIFDGFSIGSNDLTQLSLGIDRDSADVSELFNEQDPAPLEMISKAISAANKTGTKIGLCGQAPSDFPEFAGFLVRKGINSISFNPDALVKGIRNILEAEKNSLLTG